MAAERRASVTWNGDLMGGSGTIDEVGSGAFGPLDVSWAARSEEASGGKTSPEELIAAAHASCFSMALVGRSGEGGHRAGPAANLSRQSPSFRARGSRRSRSPFAASVPGLDADAFREAAEGAKKNCPVSQALAGVPEITLDAQLDA